MEEFHKEMKEREKEKAKDYGDSWKQSTDEFLLSMLTRSLQKQKMIDVANFAYFIWQNRKNNPKKFDAI